MSGASTLPYLRALPYYVAYVMNETCSNAYTYVSISFSVQTGNWKSISLLLFPVS